MSAASLPKATLHRARRRWWLWLVPLGAVALCGWFVYRDFVATGPAITISFQNADGLQEENTRVRFRGATIGRVTDLRLTPDNQRVEVDVRLVHSAAQLARAGSVFWIVRPEVKIGAVSGLRTIISGEYITVLPGDGARTNRFLGADKEPVADPAGALHVKLTSPALGSLREQSPVFYRGVQVGEVMQYQLGDDAREVVAQVRIRAEYASLVRRNSVFWNAGGLNVHFGLFRGAQISAESPSTLLTGGIEFATPPDLTEPAPENAVFTLHEKPQDEWKTWAPAIRLKLPEQAPPTPAPMFMEEQNR